MHNSVTNPSVKTHPWWSFSVHKF